jgi:glycosyltransferase involved in cell wall biosynthesis
MKILLLSRYDYTGASSRVRFYQYVPYLEKHGIEVSAAPLFGSKYLAHYYQSGSKAYWEIVKSFFARVVHLSKSRRFDIVWIEKELFPFLPAWGERLLSLLGIPYIVDYDDAIFHNYDLNSRGLVRLLLRNKIDLVMRRASLVIAGNEYLAGRAIVAGAKRVDWLPSVVDANRYFAAPPSPRNRFTIGWIGSPSTAPYLKLVEPSLTKACAATGAQVVLVGAGGPELTGVPFEVRQWSEQSEVADIQSFDVGIMPLPDSPWERGKCGYKLIQCMACGIPVVASPVGINSKIVTHGVNGFLAQTMDEWTNALITLLNDQKMRREMGLAARRAVESEYSLQVTAPRLLSFFLSVASGGVSCAA